MTQEETTMTQEIKDLLHMDMDTFTDEELEDVTISAQINGVTYYIDTIYCDSIDIIFEAIEKEDWDTE